MREVGNDLLQDKDLKREMSIDAQISLEDLSEELVDEIGRLEPYGVNNPEPVLRVNSLEIMKYPRTVGSNHLKLRVRQMSQVYEAIGFNMGELVEALTPGHNRVDVAFNAQLNEWQKNSKVQLRLKDIIIY